MRSRWLSLRSLGCTVVMLVWAAGCLFAGWWQATRAMDGNALSYLYAVEWPIFALGGVVVWWLMLHTAPVTAEEREQRRELEAAKRVEAQAAKRRLEEEDEDLKAHTDHLAALAEADHQLRRDA